MTYEELVFDHRRYQRDRILYLVNKIEKLTGKRIENFPKLHKMYLDFCVDKITAPEVLYALMNKVDELFEIL